MTKTANLDWAIALAAVFMILLVSLLRSHAKGFRLKILLMAASLCGIAYFLAGKYAALGTVLLGLIFSFITVHRKSG